MIGKLRIKFVCIIMAVVVVMLGIIFGLVLHVTGQNMEAECMQTLQWAAGNPGFMPDRRDGAPNLPWFSMTQDLWGNVHVSGSVNLEIYTEAELQSFWAAAQKSQSQFGQIEAYNLRFARGSGPAGRSVAFVDITSHRSTMRSLIESCILVGTVSVFVFLGISILLARWAVRPVETAWEQQRQFVADASHELKTPLTVILTNAELLREPEYGPEQRQRFADNILAMSCRMRGLVESLLQLARADCGQYPSETAVLDWGALVEEALLPFEPLYFEQGLTLESRLEPGIRVKGNTGSLKQLVDILLDNGLKYASPGGCVYLELKRHGRNQCLLRVSSPGAALTAQQCRDIFRRFYRVDEARSAGQSYGLGLAIARRIVEDHRGRIWAQSAENVNTFFVLLQTA